MRKHWWVLLEESEYDVVSVSGPFEVHVATSLARTLNGEAMVVDETGAVLPHDREES